MISPEPGTKPLPLRTINRLEEGDVLTYRPILRHGEERKGQVAMVLIPANRTAAGEDMQILEPKDANKPQQWKVPWRVSLLAFVYGPQGLSTKKVRKFLSRDDEVVGQLADYADKTAKTEALIAEISSPDSSDEAFQAAMQGFSSQFGLSVQIARNAPMQAQASALFQAINPQMATYDPLSSQDTPAAGQTARLATSVGELFFGTPVGLAAGGTALVLDLRALAFPNSEFRSSFTQPLPDDGLGLCGKTGASPPHTKLDYLWAMRVRRRGEVAMKYFPDEPYTEATAGPDDALPGEVKPYFLRAGEGPRHLLFGQVAFQLMRGAESGGKLGMTVTEGADRPFRPTCTSGRTRRSTAWRDGCGSTPRARSIS